MRQADRGECQRQRRFSGVSRFGGRASGASTRCVMETFVAESPKKSRAAKTFFATALEILVASQVPFLVGGGYALKRHIGLKRPARDLDVFVDPHDTQRVLQLFGK